MARSFPAVLVARVRALPLATALAELGYHVAVDRDFTPAKDASSVRWIVSGERSSSELVITGVRWFDTRAGKGGGGAIDLIMHLEGLSFVGAVRRLERAVRS